MNYLAEIKALNDLQQINPLSTGQIVLWYALIAINNKCSWAEWFTAANQTLEFATGLSKSGIAKARNALKQRGLIDFEIRTNRAAIYHIIPLANRQEGNWQVIGKCSESNQQVGGKCSAGNPLNKQKQKLKQEKRDTNVSPKETDAFETFAEGDECLLEALRGFETMRKQIKKPLTSHAKELTCKELLRLCGADRLMMTRILEQSVMNSWQGVFPLREDKKGVKSESKNIFFDLLEGEKRREP